MMGIKKPGATDEKTILKLAKKYKIPVTDVYELDSSYKAFILSVDTVTHKEQRKNHFQPLQALYYDKSGRLQSFHINCYAGGFPNLKWNRGGIMQSFPPGQQAPTDSLLPLNWQLKFLRPLPGSSKIAIENYDYVTVVHWNRFMGKQSRRLIQQVQKNCKLAANQKVKIIYVNSDNLFSK